jgi:hypothetical protein
VGTIVASPFCILLISRSLVAEIKLGVRRFGARTDGGLFFSLPQEGQFIAWDRSYYEIALEVECLWDVINRRQNAGSRRSARRMVPRMSRKLMILMIPSIVAKSLQKCSVQSVTLNSSITQILKYSPR